MWRSASGDRLSRSGCNALSVALLVAAAATTTTRPAYADDAKTGKALADALFEQGKTRLREGDWPGACQRFEESFRADPAVSTAVKIARCREHEGRLASALTEYQRAADLNRRLTRSPERARELERVIRDAIETLEDRVPKLKLVIDPRPPGLEVRVDGRLEPDAGRETPLLVDAGEHELSVEAAEYRSEHVSIKLADGETRTVSVTLTRATSPGGAPAAPSPHPNAEALPPAFVDSPVTRHPNSSEVLDEPRKRRGSTQRVLALVVGGSGVVVLGAAGYFGLRTLSLVSESEDHCNAANQCDAEGVSIIERAATAQSTGLILAGIGVALAAGGLALYVTAPEGAAAGAPRWTASVSASSVALGGSF